MRRLAGYWLAHILIAATLSGGCDSSVEDVVPVQGKVFYHGEPLAGGMIVFSPDPERGLSGPPTSASIAEDGSFRLESSLGWHRISIAGPARAPGRAHAAHFPRHYRQPDRSGLAREIKPGTSNVFEFDLSGD